MKNFCVDEKMAGEDAPPYASEKLLIVCDGLGGSGSSQHMIDGKLVTSAYQASRWVSKCVQEYLERTYEVLWKKECCQIETELKEEIQKRLKDQVTKYDLKKGAQGSSMRLLPTTLAAAVYRVTGETIEVLVIWAGDSRIYCLDPDRGLQQLSKDDVDGEFDAYRLASTASMSNCICEDRDFFINCIGYKFSKAIPMFLFCASDGCFDYFSSPMELERFYLSMLQNLKAEDGIEKYGDLIAVGLKSRILHDDCTIAGICFSDLTVSELQSKYWERASSLKKLFERAKQNNSIPKDSLLKEKDTLNMQMDILMRTLPQIVAADMMKALERKDEIWENFLTLSANREYLRQEEEYQKAKMEQENQISSLNVQWEQIAQESRSMFEKIYLRSKLEKPASLLDKCFEFIEKGTITKIDDLQSSYQRKRQFEIEFKAALERNIKLSQECLSQIEEENNFHSFAAEKSFEFLYLDICKLQENICNETENFQNHLERYKAKPGYREEFEKAYHAVQVGQVGVDRNYMKYPEYREVKQKIGKLRELERSIDTICRQGLQPPSVKEYYNGNRKAICKEYFSKYPEQAGEFLAGYPEVQEYLKAQKKREEIKQTLDEEQDNMKKLWEEYRKNYERYETYKEGEFGCQK